MLQVYHEVVVLVHEPKRTILNGAVDRVSMHYSRACRDLLRWRPGSSPSCRPGTGAQSLGLEFCRVSTSNRRPRRCGPDRRHSFQDRCCSARRQAFRPRTSVPYRCAARPHCWRSLSPKYRTKRRMFPDPRPTIPRQMWSSGRAYASLPVDPARLLQHVVNPEWSVGGIPGINIHFSLHSSAGYWRKLSQAQLSRS